MEEQIRNYQKVLKTNPTDLPAFTALEEIYKGKDRWRELVDLYQERIRHVQESDSLRLLHEKCAIIWNSKLGDLAKAETCYEQLLRLDRGNRMALEGLVELYRKRSEWGRLAVVLEQLAAVTEDSAERGELFARLGRLYQEQIKRRDRALISWGYALAADPKKLEAYDALRALYVELGYLAKARELLDREREVAGTEPAVLGAKYLESGRALLAEPLLAKECRRALEQAAELLPDAKPARQALEELQKAQSDWEVHIKKLRVEAVEAPDKNRAVNLYRQIAEIFYLQGGHEAQVEENLDKCILLQPASPRLLQFIERYYLETKRPKQLIDRLRDMVGRIKDRRTATSLLERVAMLSAVHLQDRKATVEAYNKILELEPGHPSAVASLVEFNQEEGRWADVVELLKGQVERQTDPLSRAESLFQIARITADHLKDPEAARFLYEEILRLDRNNLRAAQALERSYEKTKDWNGLVRSLEIQLQHQPDPAERIKLLDRLVEIHRDKRSDPLEAFQAVLRSLALDAGRKKVVKEAFALGEATGRYQDLASALRAALSTGQVKGKGGLEVLLNLAGIYEKRLNNSGEAVKVYQSVLELDPKNMPALDALERLQAATGGSVELVAIYRHQLELVRSGQKRKELLLKLATIYQERMADFSQAIDAYRQILEIDDKDLQAWGRLADLYERDGKWQEAAEALQHLQEGQADPAALQRAMYRLASIFEQRLNDTEKALALCSELLSAEHIEPELAAGTVTILERLQGRGVSPLRIAEILQPYYALSGDWRRHIDMLELRLEGCGSPEERVQLLGRIAQVYEDELGQKEMAFSAWVRAFRELPGDEVLLATLRRLAAETGRLEDLAAALEEALQRVDQPAQSAVLNRVLGDMYREALNRPPNAIACYRRLQELQPGDTDVPIHLSELYRVTQRWEELAGVLRHRAESAEGAEARELWLQLGQLTEVELRDRPAAIAIYQQLDATLGDESEVLQRLGALLEKEARWPELAAVLERMIPLAPPDQASELNLKLGRVRAERMDERLHAVEHYRQVLAERPDDPRAIEALEALLGRPDSAPAAAELLMPLYEQRSDWSGLVRTLEVRSEAAGDVERKVSDLRRVAEIYDRHLNQMDRSFAALRKAFRLDPQQEELLQYMQRLVERSGAYDGLAAALEEAVGSVREPREQVALLQVLAGLYRDKLRRPDLAMTSLRRLLEVEPRHASALASLEVLYRDAKAFQDLAWVLMRQADAATDMEKRRDILAQAAHLFEEQLADLSGAVTAYEQIFKASPDDIHAAKQLDRLYVATGRWEDAAALLPQLAALSKNIIGQIDYQSRLAGIMATRLDNPRRAVQIYSQILTLKPNHADTVASLEKLLADERCRQPAAEVLDGVYRSNGEWRKLAAVLEMRLAAAADKAERAGYYRQLQELYEGKIDERALAFNVLARAIREVPQDEGIGREIMRLAQEGGFFEELVGVLQDMAEHHVGTDLAIRLRKQIAEIEEVHLGKRAEAIEQWVRLLEVDPNDPAILASLERLYREAGNFQSLIDIYRRQYELTDDAARKKELLFQMAATMAEGVEDIGSAIDVYRRILDVDADDRRALKLLDQLLVVTERWSDLAAVLEREIALSAAEVPDSVEEDQRQDLLLRMAHLQLERLDNPAEALGALQMARARRPADLRAVEILERMLPQERTRMAAAELLEPAYRQLQDYRKLVAITEVRLAARTDSAQRLALYRELMGIYEEALTQKPLAFMVACRAYRENHQDDGIRQDLERLAKETGSFEELAGVYEEVLSSVEGTTVHALIERRLAQLKESYLQDKDEAVSHWRQVLASDPDDQEALRSLERLFRERGAFNELVGILRHMAALEKNPDRKKDLYHEVATLMEERLGRNDGAIEAYTEILSEDPEDLAVMKLLDRLLEKERRFDELRDVLVAEIGKAASGELVELKLRLAGVLRAYLGQPAEAVALFAEVLRETPQQPEAVAALISMFDAGEAKRPAAEVLVDVLEATGDWRHLIAALEALCTASEDAAQRKAFLARMAAIYEHKLQQKELAFNAMARAFQEDPADEAIGAQLELLAEQTQEFDMLAAVYQRQLEAVEERPIELRLRRRLAELYLGQLSDTTRARDQLQAVVALDGKDVASLLALEHIHREQGNWDALADVLRRRLRQLQSPEEISALLYEVASIYEEKLGDIGGAIQAYRDVLEVQSSDINALRMLDRLCASQGRVQERAEIIVAQINLLDGSGDLSEALDLRFRLGQLYEQEFGDNTRAAQLYRDILQADPSHPATVEHLESQLSEGRSFEGAMNLLEASYEQTGDWKKYLDILESQVRQSRVMARRLELLRKVAQVQEHRMGLGLMAFNTYVRMFHEDLADPGVRQELERLAAQEENLEGLAAVYEEELDNIEEPAVGAEIALKVAQIQQQQLEDEDEALRFYRTTLRFDPRNLTALAALADLYSRHDQPDELVEVLSKQVNLLAEPGDLVPALYRLGSVLYERLQQSSKAVGYFRRALDLDPQHMDSLRVLERIFAEQGDQEALYDVLKEHLNQVSEPGERVELVARLTDLAADQPARLDEAIELWKGTLEEDPKSQDAYEALDRLYEQAGRWVELAALLESRMLRTTDPERIAALSSRLGWVKGEKLGELEEAMKNWQEVLRLDPKNANALQALRGIYAAGGQWDKLLSVLRKLVPLQEDMAGVKNIRFELADILGEKLERREEAIEAAKRALDIEPHTAQDLERLSRIFRANEAWQDAVAILEQSVNLFEAPADKVDVLLEVAEIWKDRIGRPLGAAPAYEKILELDPSHEEAYRAVEAIYRQSKEWRRLTALLEAHLLNVRERRDRLELMKEIGSIYESNLGQKELAFARYCAAFREDFSDDQVLSKLETLARDTEDYETLLEVLEDATEEVTTGPRAVRLLQKTADIYRLRMGEVVKAEEVLRRSVDLDRRDISSLESLAELLTEQSRWEDLVQVLETKYERSDELDQRKEIRSRIAQLQEEKLERIDLAIESFRRILELDGRDPLAIQSLIRLYQQEERWSELIQVMRRAAEQAETREVSTNYLYNIATVYETEMNSEEDAVEAYRNVLEQDSSHMASIQALERIYTRHDRWSELLQVFEQEVSLVEDPAEKIKIYNKMGSIWEERFSNIANAAACYESILELDPLNLPAIKSLERLVRRMGDFSRLIDLYYRHIGLISDRDEIVNIHLAIGEVWYRELSRVDRAEEVFTKALEIDDQSREAIHALGQLYEKSGNWFNAIDMLQREAELSGATPEAVDLYYRMGKINEDMLLDSHAARDAYTKALSVDPSYLPAVKALKLIFYLDKEYDRYLEMMIQEAEHTEDVEEKTRLFYEIGKFLQEQRDESVQAAVYYEEALRRTPDFLPAAKPLADIYFRSEQWEKAEQMMEVVVAGLDRNTESKELCRQYYRLGYITEKLGKEERALEHYRMSYELDATYLPALEGLGNALLKAEKWDEAYRIYQTILIHHRDSLSDAEVAELYWQIGDVNYHLNELDRAVASFNKALEIDSSHLASLQYLVRIYEQKESWEEAYDYGMQIIDALDDDDLYQHYLRMADLCRQRLQDPFRAVDVLQGALRLRSDSLEVLTRMLEVFLETSQHQKAVETIDQIVKVESRPRKLVEYHLKSAGLLRDELRDDMRAVEHHNAALDLDPSAIESFQAAAEILTRRKDWLALKENYIRMIKRLPIEARKTKLALWKDLGELCRVVLRSLNESIDAYRMVTTLDPDDVDSLVILGDLLAAKQGAADEAIATHHKVLSMAADRVKSYRSLWKLYNARKEYDKVFVLTTVLRYLKKADEEEQKIVNYFTKKAPQAPSRPVTDQLWEQTLAHPGVKVPFTRIFGIMYRMAAPMFLVEHKDVNLSRREHQIDLARDRSLFAHNFRIAAKVLGGPEVELFAFKEETAKNPPGLALALTRPTAIIAYKDVFQEDKKKHLLFHIGRQLAMTRPEFLLASALPVVELNNLLQAACQLVNPEQKVEGDPRGVERARNGLRRALTEQGVGMLKRVVSEYLKDPKSYNIRRWVEAVEHSVIRAGLLACNDLTVALAIVRQETVGLTPMRPIQKVTELLKFSSSPEHFRLREAIGLAVS